MTTAGVPLLTMLVIALTFAIVQVLAGVLQAAGNDVWEWICRYLQERRRIARWP